MVRTTETPTERFEAFSGPLPHPDHFAAYQRTLPGAADRILALTEQQTAHRQRQEERNLEADVEARRRGQWFAFLIAAVSLGMGGYLAGTGANLVGGIVLAVALTELGIATYGKLRQMLAPPRAGRRTDDAPPAPPDAPRPERDRAS